LDVAGFRQSIMQDALTDELALPMHEGLLRVSEKARGDRRDPSSVGVVGSAGEEGSTWLGFLRHCLFQSAFVVSVPAPGKNALWMFERLVSWVQVRLIPHPVCVFSNIRTSADFTQVLGFAFSDSSQLLWGQTMLSPLSRGLSALSLIHVGDPNAELLLFGVFLAFAVASIGGFLFVGWATGPDRSLPTWVVQVRLITYAF
jgi:hypothetical protein